MVNNNQRMGSVSNAHVGNDFEASALKYFQNQGENLKRNFSVEIGVRAKRSHKFDLGSDNPPILVECKSHTWTSGDNIPSAKITVWNEAMYYFFLAPKHYKKVLFVLKSHSEKRKETLAEYYIRTHGHLIPDDVQIIEFGSGGQVNQLL